MKTILIAAFVMMTAVGKSQSFTTYADSANYLIHEIKANKSLYVNRPFSILLDSLKIQPVAVIEGTVKKADFGKCLRFYFNYEREFNKKHFITIDFDSVPPYEVLRPIFYPPGGANEDFNQILNIYRQLIVKDVSVKLYDQDEPRNPAVIY
jgi:hypothetical protein